MQDNCVINSIYLDNDAFDMYHDRTGIPFFILFLPLFVLLKNIYINEKIRVKRDKGKYYSN